jgi:hypothetical protein
MASRQQKHRKKEFHSHAVGHSRRSRLDHGPPLTWCFAVGVAGFEPTASSSRTRVERASQYQRMPLRARGWLRRVLWYRLMTMGC